MAHQSSKMRASITSLTPGPVVTDQDNNPSDIQPPGVDEDDEPQSLEEALTGS